MRVAQRTEHRGAHAGGCNHFDALLGDVLDRADGADGR